MSIPRRPAPPRRGLSLIEVTLSAGASAVLVAGLSSAVLISTSSFNRDDSATTVNAIAADVLAKLADELAVATDVTTLNSHEIGFDVDRGGPVSLAYGWDGNAGDPLERTVDGAAADLLPALDDLTFAYVTEPYAYFDQTAGATSETEIDAMTSGNSKSETLLDQNLKIGLYYRPDFASDVTSWRITEFTARLAKEDGGTFDVRLRNAAGDHAPTGGDLMPAIAVDADSLGKNPKWVDIDFVGAPSLDPDQAVVILFDRRAAETPCAIEYRQSGHSESRYHLVEGESGGATFVVDQTDQCPRFRLRAEVTTSDLQVREVDLLRRVDVSLRPTGTAEPLKTSVTLHGAVEVSP